jgi:LacI family transcriptional regulator
MKQKKEVGFTGFHQYPGGRPLFSGLTEVRQPAFEIGQTAIELLIQIIESKRPVTDFETRSARNGT